MKIYHGTSELHLKSILLHGIKPRGMKKSNWKDYPSRHDMVYLSTAYAPYFSLMGMDKPVVFEVDMNELNIDYLHPDEDFISQAIARQEKKPLKDVHDRVRNTIERYQHHWELSIEQMGNCCYLGKIPLNAITRYVTWDISAQSHVSLMASDPVISVINYQLCGEKYRNLTAWLFGDDKELQSQIRCFQDSPTAMESKYINHLKEISTNRKSIKVVAL